MLDVEDVIELMMCVVAIPFLLSSRSKREMILSVEHNIKTMDLSPQIATDRDHILRITVAGSSAH